MVASPARSARYGVIDSDRQILQYLTPNKRPTEVKNTLPIRRIEGSKAPTETLIRYFINDIDP